MIRECWDRKETYSTFLGGMAWGGVGIEMNRFIGWGGNMCKLLSGWWQNFFSEAGKLADTEC